MPLATVIIPTYNRAYVLPRAIKSVLAQTHQEFELLVVDDGSMDNTRQVVHEFSDPRIIYVQHEKNKGQCAAINTGIRSAKGKYISFLDSDDEWLPSMLEKQLEVFMQAEDSKLGIVYTLSGSRNADGSLSRSKFNTLRGEIYKEALTQGYVAPSITLMVRKECFDKVGLFDTRFACFQDDDICFRLAKEYTFDFVPEFLAIIHHDADFQLTEDRAAYARGWLDLVTKHESVIQHECGDRVLADHYFKAGTLFVEARQIRTAHRSFSRAYRLSPSLRNLTFALITKLPSPVFLLGQQWVRELWRVVRKVRAAKRKPLNL